MAEMNQAQAKYARQRAQEIYTTKKNVIERQLNIQPKHLTLGEKLAKLKAGEFTIREMNEYDRQWYGNNVENFIQFAQLKQEPTVNKEELTNQLIELKAAYNALCDELMLGDNAEALKLLKAFEAS